MNTDSETCQRTVQPPRRVRSDGEAIAANQQRAGLLIRNAGDATAYLRIGPETTSDLTPETAMMELPPGSHLDRSDPIWPPTERVEVVFQGSSPRLIITEWIHA